MFRHKEERADLSTSGRPLDIEEMVEEPEEGIKRGPGKGLGVHARKDNSFAAAAVSLAPPSTLS